MQVKRRKVGNLLGLAVLSAVVQRPMHPYEMASVLRSHGKEDDMGLKWGSLYTVVRNLTKHGFLEVADSTREGARPERTVYRITEAGRAEMIDWVRELISVPQPELPKFKAGLSVLAVLSPDEAVTLLRERLDAVQRANAERRAALARYGEHVPRLFLVEDEYELALREAEAAWIGALLDELTTGAFPGVDGWREWHRTGTLPPDAAGPAEGGNTSR
jgi:DNA-binding PadR family transcriptional regulator